MEKEEIVAEGRRRMRMKKLQRGRIGDGERRNCGESRNCR